jgi:signal transduction histidine kinase
LLAREDGSLAGERFADLVPEPVAPNPRIPASPLQLVRRAAGGKLYLETEIQSGGRRVPISVSAVLVRDRRNKVTGLLLVLHDISERKQTEAALRRTEKLAAAGRLAATIAHEINNPLEAVTNLLYLAKMQPDEAKEYLLLADQELARVTHIARQTLGFYRDTSSPTSVNIFETLENVLFLYAKRLDSRRIVVRKRYDPDVRVMGFAGELRQVLSNVISNSMDAIGHNGTISIKVAAGSSWKDERVPGVRITIGDTGPGIRPEHLEKIFEPFFTTKVDIGTGLGLWVSRGIVQKHHGFMRVRSSTAPGRSGTVFSIFLPAHALESGADGTSLQALHQQGNARTEARDQELPR